MKWYNAIPLTAVVFLATACGSDGPTSGKFTPRAASRTEAPVGSIFFTGQGVNSDGTFGTEQCNTDPSQGPLGAYIHWIFTANEATSAVLTLPSGPVAMFHQGAGDGAFHYYQTTDVPADLNSLKNVVYVTPDPNTATGQLTISHGCPGEPPPPPQAILALSKTAVTSYRRTWKWSVAKTVTPTAMTLPINTTQNAAYKVTFSAVASDDQFVVSGTITVSNSGTASAIVTNISDALPAAQLTCPTFPATVAAGATVECTYTMPVGSAASGSNTASATATKLDGTTPIPIDDALKSYAFGANATTEVNRCVNVSDTKKSLDPANICAPQDGTPYSQEYSYSLTVGPYTATACGPQNFPNTASFTPTSAALVTGANSASANVAVTVTGCQGCTPGYWKSNTTAWAPTGFATSTKIYAAFGSASVLVSPWTYQTTGSMAYVLSGTNLGSYTMLQGLGFQGSSTLEGKGEILLRAGNAALLNASWNNGTKSFAYPLTAAQVKSEVLTALGNPGTAADGYKNLTDAATRLDKFNNYACPLNSKGAWIGG